MKNSDIDWQDMWWNSDRSVWQMTGIRQFTQALVIADSSNGYEWTIEQEVSCDV